MICSFALHEQNRSAAGTLTSVPKLAEDVAVQLVRIRRDRSRGSP